MENKIVARLTVTDLNNLSKEDRKSLKHWLLALVKDLNDAKKDEYASPCRFTLYKK